jgi:uncharacterized protein GlcG (DUF336 family)
VTTPSTSQGTLSLEDARRVTAAGEDCAREIGQPQNIAVVDAGGIPLKRHGQVVGAVGVSGGDGDQDTAVAEAAAAAF